MKNKVGVVGGAGHIGLPFSCYIQNKGIDMKNMDKLYRTIQQQHWGMPLLGLLTAHHWFLGNIQHWTWWLLIVSLCLAGVVKR